MKTNHTLKTTAGVAALGLALLFTGCARDNDTTATTADTDTTPAPVASTSPGATMSAAVSNSWEDLKTYSYDQRSDFAERANDYAERLDDRIDDAKGEASTRLAEARDELREAASEVSNATAETWEATKERVGRAWQKAESAAQSIAE